MIIKIEIRLCDDGGRLTRPVLRMKDGNLLLTKDIIEKLVKNELQWNDLLIQSVLPESVIEYIDPDEQNYSLIAMKSKGKFLQDDNVNYTHSEIHPSTIFGVLASCTPFPDHNQAPRNTYQCAMAKQAVGVYAMNYDQRMDKTSYVLSYPNRPLVDTRLMNFIHLNKIPSGSQIHVAIMTHTGYNQEDSVLVNKGSIDRGLFSATIYHTERDEDNNIIRDEIIRCKPDPTKTKGIKFGNYDKLDNQGFIPENTLIKDRDIIIAKIVPIKENRNDHTKVIKYEDQSIVFSTAEETYIDKNYTNRNGDGYNFAKVRVRQWRKPVYGDKFCVKPTQQVLTNKGWIQIKDINIAKHKVCTLDKNNNLYYEYPKEKFTFDHDENMYCLKTNQLEIVCTLNHKLYIKPFKSKNYILQEAGYVYQEKVQFQKTMNNQYISKDKINIEILEFDLDNWLIVLGLYINFGKIYNQKLLFYIPNLRLIGLLENALIELNIKYTRDQGGRLYILEECPSVYVHFYNLNYNKDIVLLIMFGLYLKNIVLSYLIQY